jgi:hypothetical protein
MVMLVVWAMGLTILVLYWSIIWRVALLFVAIVVFVMTLMTLPAGVAWAMDSLEKFLSEKSKS